MSRLEIIFDTQPITYNRTLTPGNNGKVLKIRDGSEVFDITCRDVAITASRIRSHKLFFHHTRKVGIEYTTDFNGSGQQRITLENSDKFSGIQWSLVVVYSPYGGPKENEHIYQAELVQDGRKDLDPMKYSSNQKFYAESASVSVKKPGKLVDWIEHNYLIWQNDLSRLDKPRGRLSDWVMSGLDMGVKCTSCSRPVKVLPNSDLEKYVADGISLSDLMRRFSCSGCDGRTPIIVPF